MEFRHPKYYAALRAERRKLQAASAKPQASSSKRQEPRPERSAQPEVVLNKKSIDKDPDVGYCGTDDVTAIHGGHSSARSVQPKATSNTGDAPHMGPRNSAAETLHLEQHKYPGDGSSRMVQGYGPCHFRIVLSYKASSYKLQATRLQATSRKLQAPRNKDLV